MELGELKTTLQAKRGFKVLLAPWFTLLINLKICQRPLEITHKDISYAMFIIHVFQKGCKSLPIITFSLVVARILSLD